MMKARLSASNWWCGVAFVGGVVVVRVEWWWCGCGGGVDVVVVWMWCRRSV